MNTSSTVQVSASATTAEEKPAAIKLGKTAKRRAKDEQRAAQAAANSVRSPKVFENIEDFERRLKRAIENNIQSGKDGLREKGIVVEDFDPFRPTVIALGWALGIVKEMEKFVPTIFEPDFIEEMMSKVKLQLTNVFATRSAVVDGEEAMSMFVGILAKKGEYHPKAVKDGLMLVKSTIAPPSSEEKSSSTTEKGVDRPAFTVDKIKSLCTKVREEFDETGDEGKAVSKFVWMVHTVRDDRRIAKETKEEIYSVIKTAHAGLIGGDRISLDILNHSQGWLEEVLVAKRGQHPLFTVEKLYDLFERNGGDAKAIMWLARAIAKDDRYTESDRAVLNGELSLMVQGVFGKKPEQANAWLNSLIEEAVGTANTTKGGELKVTPSKALVDLNKLSPEERAKEVKRRQDEAARLEAEAKAKRVAKQMAQIEARKDPKFGAQVVVAPKPKKGEEGGGKKGKKGRQQPQQGR